MVKCFRSAWLVLFLGAILTCAAPRYSSGADHAEGATGHVETPAEERAAVESEEDQILALRPSLAVATVIVFGLLLAVLWKFAWGPLAQALHDREHGLEHTLQETERARQDAERLLAQHREQMAQAAEQARGLLDQARRDAQASSDELIKKAQAEAESARHRAETEIGLARDQALKDIWTQSADLAVSIAGKVLERELRPDDHRRLVEQALAELPSAPKGREGLN